MPVIFKISEFLGIPISSSDWQLNDNNWVTTTEWQQLSDNTWVTTTEWQQPSGQQPSDNNRVTTTEWQQPSDNKWVTTTEWQQPSDNNRVTTTEWQQLSEILANFSWVGWKCKPEPENLQMLCYLLTHLLTNFTQGLQLSGQLVWVESDQVLWSRLHWIFLISYFSLQWRTYIFIFSICLVCDEAAYVGNYYSD